MLSVGAAKNRTPDYPYSAKQSDRNSSKMDIFHEPITSEPNV